MEEIRILLAWGFTYLLYPGVVLGIFGYIGTMLHSIINAASGSFVTSIAISGRSCTIADMI